MLLSTFFHRPKDAIKAIKKRLSAPKNFKIVILTLTVSGKEELPPRIQIEI